MEKIIYFVFICILILFFGCGENDTDTQKNGNINSKSSLDSQKSISENNSNKLSYTDKFTLSDFYATNMRLDKKIDEIFNSLSDEEKIGQMIVPAVGKYGKPESEIINLIKSKKIGGVLLLKGSKGEFKSYIEKFNNQSKESNSLPLIFSADAEPSLINNKISGLKKINATNTIKNIKESSNTAKDICIILKEIGINQNYAPVCDFSNNKEIIGDRSFGINENEIIKLSREFIKQTQENNIIATAKHFPGHGYVSGDSHKEIVYINGELKELNVFKEMIESGVISILVGHIAIKGNKIYNTDGYPSTISRNIVTGLLKNELGFKGLVITDAMNMVAVSKFQSPSLKAIEAGCDMVLMPSDEMKLINSIKALIVQYPEFRDQVYESVKKVIRVKVCLGVM